MTHSSTPTASRAYRRRKTHTHRFRLGPKANLHGRDADASVRPSIAYGRVVVRQGEGAAPTPPDRPPRVAQPEFRDVEVVSPPRYERRWLVPVIQEVTEVSTPRRHSTTRHYPVSVWTPLQQYIVGINDEHPPDSAAKLAAHFVGQAVRRSTKTEIDFDDEDGSLLFDLRLPNGLLLMAELYLDGTLYAGVHDDRGAGDSQLVEWLENPNETEINELFSEE